MIEVSGTFQEGLDYQACFDRGIEGSVLRARVPYAVAEMALGMMIAGARGLVQEHEAFRPGTEDWLQDNPATDFTLYGQDIGFVGYGGIARRMPPAARAVLARPCAPSIPGLIRATWPREGVQLCDLDDAGLAKPLPRGRRRPRPTRTGS